MNDGILPPMGVCIVTICRILRPLNWQRCEWFGETPEGGAISSMKVAVPTEVLDESAAAGNLDSLDLWVEDEFGFPWVLAKNDEMIFMSTEQFHEWSTEI